MDDKKDRKKLTFEIRISGKIDKHRDIMPNIAKTFLDVTHSVIIVPLDVLGGSFERNE